MDQKREIHKLVDAIEHEHVLRFIRAFIYFIVNEKDGVKVAENLIRLFGAN